MPDRSLTRPRTRRAVLAVAVAVGLAAVAGCASDRDPQVEAGVPPSTVPPATSPVEATTTSTTSPGVTVTTAPPASSTTTSAGPATTTTTTASPAATVPPASIVTADPVASPTLAMAVFWVRPPDDPRTLDIPGYRDPASGPKPLVVYGSATNTGGEAVASPVAVARFLDGSGQVVAMATAPIVRAGSAERAASLAPGETGDVIVVIAGDQATALAGLTPELVGGTAG